jgi:hypothetical protein
MNFALLPMDAFWFTGWETIPGQTVKRADSEVSEQFELETRQRNNCPLLSAETFETLSVSRLAPLY